MEQRMRFLTCLLPHQTSMYSYTDSCPNQFSMCYFLHVQVVFEGKRLVLQGPALLEDFQELLESNPPTYSQVASTQPPCPLSRSISVAVNSTGG